MSQQTIEQKIFHIYCQFFQYKDLLKGSPALTVNPNALDDKMRASFMPTVEAETAQMVGYLMGLRGTAFTVSQMLVSLNKYYQKDDFWRRLLLEYIDLCQEKEEAAFMEESRRVRQEGEDLLKRINLYRASKKEIIDSFAAALKAQKFPVDAQKLIRNYLNMAEKNATEAWNVLTTNPAAFAPLEVVTPEGKRLMAPKEAIELNKKMGAFLRKLKT